MAVTSYSLAREPGNFTNIDCLVANAQPGSSPYLFVAHPSSGAMAPAGSRICPVIPDTLYYVNLRVEAPCTNCKFKLIGNSLVN